MKRSLILLAITLTSSMANTSVNPTESQSMDILTKNQTVIREIRNFRETPKNRVLKIEITREIPSSRLTRVNREIRENRFIVQTARESRRVRYVLVQNRLHLARLK